MNFLMLIRIKISRNSTELSMKKVYNLGGSFSGDTLDGRATVVVSPLCRRIRVLSGQDRQTGPGLASQRLKISGAKCSTHNSLQR